MFKKRDAFTLIELLIVIAILNVLMALFMPAVEMSREAARQLQCKNNLRQLGIASEGYSSIHEAFPPGVKIDVPHQCDGIDCRGTGLFVTLLPYIEQDNWHQHYDNDAPHGWLSWVSDPANVNLANVEMPLYLCPSEGEFHKFHNRRHYFGVSGGKTSNGIGIRGNTFLDGIFGLNRQTRHAQITDGTSKTFAMGESSHVAWAGLGPGNETPEGGPAPWYVGGACLPLEDMTACNSRDHSYGRVLRPTLYDPNSSILPMGPQLSNEVPFGSEHPGITHFLYADGHVEVIADGIDLEVYRALSTFDGQELVR